MLGAWFRERPSLFCQHLLGVWSFILFLGRNLVSHSWILFCLLSPHSKLPGKSSPLTSLGGVQVKQELLPWWVGSDMISLKWDPRSVGASRGGQGAGDALCTLSPRAEIWQRLPLNFLFKNPFILIHTLEFAKHFSVYNLI